MDLGLGGKVAVVTGASQGIGREVALGLAREGADVVLVARRREPLEKVAGEIAELGRAAEVVVADVALPEAAPAVMDATLARFGGVDVLVNNAGKGSPQKLLDTTDADWQAAIELNLMGAVRLSRACVPLMQARGGGRIVNVSSRVAREPDTFFAPYGAAKAALVNFSKSLANAFSADGILTNCVVPGLVHSEAVDQAAEKSAAATGRTVEEVFAETLRRRPIPVGRLGEPAEVAGLIVFLCSAQASWITGACLTVDGGIVRSAF